MFRLSPVLVSFLAGWTCSRLFRPGGLARNATNVAIVHDDKLHSPLSGGICAAFGSGVTTEQRDLGFRTDSIWSDNIDRIISASRHPADKQNVTVDRTAAQLRDLTPIFLQNAIKARPRLGDVERLIDIVERRRKDPQNSRPLTVLVLGGSVTEGRGCNEPFARGRQCSWPFRLEAFANEVLGFNAVRVVNAASGGTGSGQGSRLIKYWMYPPEILPQGPDVIINGYGMNDSFLYGALKLPEFERAGKQLKNIMKSMNSFIGMIEEAHPCHTPVVVYLDDYLGTHNQGNLLFDMAYNGVMTVAMKWYRNLAVSSADVVRRVVLADTSETLYTPAWEMENGRYKEEVHFGAGSHMLILWSFAYSILDSVTSFCQDLHFRKGHQQQLGGNSSDVTPSTEKYTFRPHALQLSNDVSPPPLTDITTLEHISEEWSKLEKARQSRCGADDDSVQPGAPCVHAWIAGPEGKTSNKNALRGYLNKFMTANKGWDCQDDMSAGWSRKLGFVATKLHAVATFEARDLGRNVRYILADYLKSYGDKWAGSAAQFTSSVKRKGQDEYKEVHQFTLEGFHNATASITHSAKEDLGIEVMAKAGDSFRIKIELIGGTTFKLMGFMFCDR